MTNPFVQVSQYDGKASITTVTDQKLVIYQWQLMPITLEDALSFVTSPDPDSPGHSADLLRGESAPSFIHEVSCQESLLAAIFQYYQVLHEFIVSEFRYLHQLYLVQYLFADPIQAAGDGRYLPEAADYDLLFGKLPQLIHLHQSFINSLFKVKKIRASPTVDDTQSAGYRIKRYDVAMDELKVDDRFERITLNFLKSVADLYATYCADHPFRKNLLAVLTDDGRPLGSSASAHSSDSESWQQRFRFRRSSSASVKSESVIMAAKRGAKNQLKEFLEYTQINQSKLLQNLGCTDYLYAIYQRPFRYPLLIGEMTRCLEKCLSQLRSLTSSRRPRSTRTGWPPGRDAAPQQSSTTSLFDDLTASPASAISRVQNPFQPYEDPFQVRRLDEEALLACERFCHTKVNLLQESKATIDTKLRSAANQMAHDR